VLAGIEVGEGAPLNVYTRLPRAGDCCRIWIDPLGTPTEDCHRS
jgi:hypothetical protein